MYIPNARALNRSNRFKRMATLSLVIALLVPASMMAQQTTFAAFKTASLEPMAPVAPVAIAIPMVVSPVTQPEPTATHRFWDHKNTLLFAGVAALSAADFFVTRANLQNGGREYDPVTRAFGGGTRGLALNFSSETAGMIGLSYVFHKTGHHKLERLTSITNIGASSTAVAYDLAHR
jgi:hypothetical protein